MRFAQDHKGGRAGTGSQASHSKAKALLNATVPPAFSSCSHRASFYEFFKAHRESFSCEIFPDCPPDMPVPPFPVSFLLCTDTQCATIVQKFVYVSVFPAELKALQSQRWALLIPGCDPST